MCRLSAFQEFGDVADPDPYATNNYLVEQLNAFNLAYLHMVESRANGASDTEGQFQEQSLAPFRKLFKGPFMAAGEAMLVLFSWDLGWGHREVGRGRQRGA